jgi:hypothetical protein
MYCECVCCFCFQPWRKRWPEYVKKETNLPRTMLRWKRALGGWPMSSGPGTRSCPVSTVSLSMVVRILVINCSFLTYICVVLKVNTKKHLKDLIKERDIWKGRCTQVANGIPQCLSLSAPSCQIMSPTHKHLG